MRSPRDALCTSCISVLAYIPSDEERARLEAVLLGRAVIHVCDCPVELSWKASRINTGTAVVCEIPEVPDQHVFDVVQGFRRRFPTIPLMLLAPKKGRSCEFEIGRAHV